MVWIELIIGGLVGFTTSVILIRLVLKARWRFGLPGRVGEVHHTHTLPVSRLGGVALAGAMVAVVLLFTVFLGRDFFLQNDRWLAVCATLAMFGLGFCDDLFGLGARRKLLGQVVIASATYFLGIGIYHFKVPFTFQVIDLGFWSWPVTVFWLVAMTNLINLIDGVDGLAGGICLMLMCLFLYVSMNSGGVPIVIAGMTGALLGFLRFNFPPARIYMGDGGAYMLGFLIGCTSIASSQKGTILAALIAPLFVLALPIIDASLAILRRGLKGLPLFRPDRKHIHHRLLAAGHSRRQVVLGLYIFTAFFLLMAFAIFALHGEYFPLFLGVGVLAVILTAGKFDFSREWFSVGRMLGNSIEARADIQYAACLSRSVALGGTRAESLEALAEDVVFVARKLGFASVQIRLEDDERKWLLKEIDPQDCDRHRHGLPGRKYCFIEMCTVRPASKKSPQEIRAAVSISEIIADLVAEGWAKAAKDWQKLHKLPARFDARLKAPASQEAEKPVAKLSPSNTFAAH